MQYSIRRVPQTVDNAVRERARASGKSLNEALEEGTGAFGVPRNRRDLGDIAGSWRPDKAAEDTFVDQDRVNETPWP